MSDNDGMMPPYDSRSIANRILEIARTKGLPLTIMQLQKLVYYAHGWWLSYSEGQPLTSDYPKAWKYGPVYDAIYDAFRGSGSQPILGYAVDEQTGLKIASDLTPAVNAMVERVVDAYGRLHAFQLSDMTHTTNPPWTVASKQYGHYAPISNELIRENFDAKRRRKSQ